MPVKFKDVKLGDVLIVTEGSGLSETCLKGVKEVVVEQFPADSSKAGELCFRCASGRHYLENEADFHGILPDFDLKAV